MAAELGHPLGVASPPEPGSARQAINEMLDAGLLDELMDRVDAGEVQLTGEGGFLPELIKAVLERGLQAELTGHLGYEKGDPAGAGSPELAQRVDPEDGRDRGRRHRRWTCRGTGPAASSRGWCPRASGASAGSTT